MGAAHSPAAADAAHGRDDSRTKEAERLAAREIARALAAGVTRADVMRACPSSVRDWLTDVVFAD